MKTESQPLLRWLAGRAAASSLSRTTRLRDTISACHAASVHGFLGHPALVRLGLSATQDRETDGERVREGLAMAGGEVAVAVVVVAAVVVAAMEAVVLFFR